MVKKWAFANTTIPSTTPTFFVKRCLLKPFHVALIVLGLVLIFSAAQMHALSTVPVSLSTHELFMQPGSALPLVVSVETPFGKNAFVSFGIDYPSSVLSVDGELNSISTSFPLKRDFTISTLWNAPRGDYLVTLHVYSVIENQTFTDTQTILVHVGKKGLVTYLTSSNTTMPANVSNVVFSSENVRVGRNENASVSVSFVNSGSATDYLVRLSEPALGFSAHVTSETHRFVDVGERVTSFVEISTTPTSPFGQTSLQVEAYDFVSGEKTFLGTIMVNVIKTTNLDVSVPFHEFVVEENGSIDSAITLDNTEYSDVDVIIESSSSLILVPLRQVHVPSKSSVSVPIIIQSSPSLGLRSDSLFILNAELTREVSFVVRTVKKGTLSPIPDVNANDSNSSDGTPISGLFVGAFSSWLGLIIIIIAALLIFSKRFREKVAGLLPKSTPPAKKKEDDALLAAIAPTENNSPRFNTTKVVATVPAEAVKK